MLNVLNTFRIVLLPFSFRQEHFIVAHAHIPAYLPADIVGVEKLGWTEHVAPRASRENYKHYAGKYDDVDYCDY